MELNRWPDNYFAEVEQAAFGPPNVVPGISFSPDRMLQARLFSYNDVVRYRLGVNFYQIPVNAPKCPFMSYHRDGKMRVDGNLGGTISFNPNNAGLWDNQPDFAEPPLPIEGEAVHYDHHADNDHWEQPGNLFRLMTPAQQQVLFENTAGAMGDARCTSKSATSPIVCVPIRSTSPAPSGSSRPSPPNKRHRDRARKNFSDLMQQELLALAIALEEEEDSRTYSDLGGDARDLSQNGADVRRDGRRTATAIASSTSTARSSATTSR